MFILTVSSFRRAEYWNHVGERFGGEHYENTTRWADDEWIAG